MNLPLASEIVTERVDDIPVLLTHLEQMGVPALLDEHFPTHGNWQGLSLGWTATIWLVHILSQADHRLNRVQDWVARHGETLRRGTGQALEALDFSDDRLGAVLRYLHEDAAWVGYEQRQGRCLIRVYDLASETVRLDTTTASTYQAAGLEGLFRRGVSKDHRPDLAQVKAMLATLDPLGLPLATTVVDGSHAAAQEAALRERLVKAQAALVDLPCPRRGKKHLNSLAEYHQAIEAILAHYRVVGLLDVQCTETLIERRVRRYGDRPARRAHESQVQLTVTLVPAAVEARIQRLGWRVYATNAPVASLGLTAAVRAYREQYIVERGFARLKGQPLSLTPMYLQREDHVTGLIRLLSIALRALTLFEFVVRRRLAGTPLAGLYPGNRTRATARPSAELLLEAFKDIDLMVLSGEHGTARHVTPLSKVQQNILALLDLPSATYTRLAGDFSEPEKK